MPIKVVSYRENRYRVCRDGSKHFEEICETDGYPGKAERLKLERNSFEVFLRYVLVDVVAA